MHLLLSTPGLTEWLVILIITVSLFFALRKVYLWYTGMMELLTQNIKQTKLLEEIRDLLSGETVNKPS